MNWGLFFYSSFNDMMQRFIDRGSALIRLRDPHSFCREESWLQISLIYGNIISLLCTEWTYYELYKLIKSPSPLAKPPVSSSPASCTTSVLHVLHCCQEFNNDTLFAYINLFFFKKH